MLTIRTYNNEDMDHNQVFLGRHNQRCKMLYSTQKKKKKILYEMSKMSYFSFVRNDEEI